VVPALSLAVPLCDEFPNGGTLTVRDVLAVTRRNVVALCDVQHATTVPAKQLVIKIRMSRDARDSLQHEMACVSVCNDVLEGRFVSSAKAHLLVARLCAVVRTCQGRADQRVLHVLN
jgi:hypothetical protein